MIQSLFVGFMSICLLLYSSCGPGQTFTQFLRAENMFIVSTETTGYKIVIDQSLTLYVIYKHSPSGVMLIYCIQTSGVVNNYYI